MTRRARIVCTLAPASRAPATVRALVDAGMDVARLNFSHGSHEEHRALHDAVRRAADEAGRAVGVMADLQGPRIRLGTFTGGEARLETGASFVITTESVEGTAARASTTYAALARDVAPGDRLLVNDGLVRLQVESTDGREVRCRVIEGGVISDHKGLNLPGVRVSAPALTEKDRADLAFALALGVDWVALSFVRAPEDADVVRRAMDEQGVRVPVIAKIEKPEAVERLEAIVDAFDGLMVARGDLGVEMPLEDVPLQQKRAIRLSRSRAKPVIVATQMLDSMIRQSRPTRAEASDVANAVLDGADALMLSGETAVGEHPLEVVRTMARIIAAAEAGGPGHPGSDREPRTPHEAIARAAARLARDLPACALVAFTESGATARRLAAHREPVPLLAFTTRPAVRGQLALTWGVETFVVPAVAHTDEMFAQVERAMLKLEHGAPGQRVVVVAGSPPGSAGSTNLIRVLELGAA